MPCLIMGVGIVTRGLRLLIMTGTVLRLPFFHLAELNLDLERSRTADARTIGFAGITKSRNALRGLN